MQSFFYCVCVSLSLSLFSKSLRFESSFFLLGFRVFSNTRHFFGVTLKFKKYSKETYFLAIYKRFKKYYSTYITRINRA